MHRQRCFEDVSKIFGKRCFDDVSKIFGQRCFDDVLKIFDKISGGNKHTKTKASATRTKGSRVG